MLTHSARAIVARSNSQTWPGLRPRSSFADFFLFLKEKTFGQCRILLLHFSNQPAIASDLWGGAPGHNLTLSTE
ncbi:hypothetical protein [Paenibacillus crassostreae]|uniref:hypothetical protein n=1 Tax=Paenibacillus crassostreae TaxID=1763538 RepID=UPI0012FD2369|nr:hypothetical protein [Paenibacillus crassostreae]